MNQLIKLLIKKHKWGIIGAIGILGAYVFIRLIPAAIMEKFINGLTNESGAQTGLVSFAVFYLLSAVLLYTAEIVKSYYSRRIAWKMTDELRVQLILKNIRMGQSFYNRYGTAEVIEHLDGDINVLEYFVRTTVIPVLVDVFSLICVIAIFFNTGLILGICFTLFCAVVFTLLYLIQKIDSNSVSEERKAMTQLTSFWAEVVELRKEIRLMCKTHNIFNRINGMMDVLKQRQIRKQKYLYRIWITSLFTFALGNVISLLIGGLFYMFGHITIGTVYLIYSYSNLLKEPMEKMQYHLQNYAAAKSSNARLCKMYKYDDCIADGEMLVDGSFPTIRVENLSHRFADTVALDHVNFEMKVNEKLGIFGKSGSGKSTISKIICKLYPLQSGEVYLFGKSIDSISISNLRKNVAYVTAGEQVFLETLKENLDLQSSKTYEEVEAMIRYYDLERFFDLFEGVHLKEKLRTVVVPEKLSVGQSQILNILRLFFSEKKIIIFDEAVANVDRSIEEDFFALFDMATSGHTTIMITHNVERLSKCDKVLALEHGRVLEYGIQQELMNDENSLYYQYSQMGWSK